MNNYETSLKFYRDLKGGVETAFDEGKKEGIMEVAKALKINGISIKIIINSTGWSRMK